MNHAKDLRPRIHGRADEVKLSLRATLRCDRSGAKDVVLRCKPAARHSSGRLYLTPRCMEQPAFQPSDEILVSHKGLPPGNDPSHPILRHFVTCYTK